MLNPDAAIIVCLGWVGCKKTWRTFNDMDMGLESLESGFFSTFVITNLSQLHVGNQKTQYIAMAYFDNQHH